MATAAMVVEENFMIALFDRCFLTVVSCLDERYYEEMHPDMRFTKYYQQFGWVSWRAIINSAVSERTEQTVFL
jgi:hypothetical protein